MEGHEAGSPPPWGHGLPLEYLLEDMVGRSEALDVDTLNAVNYAACGPGGHGSLNASLLNQPCGMFQGMQQDALRAYDGATAEAVAPHLGSGRRATAVEASNSDSDDGDGDGPSGSNKRQRGTTTKSKACREKARREKINDRFVELAKLIEPGKEPKTDKSTVLCDAIKFVQQQTVENHQLRQLNKFLEERVAQFERERGQQLYHMSHMMQPGMMQPGMMQPGMMQAGQHMMAGGHMMMAMPPGMGYGMGASGSQMQAMPMQQHMQQAMMQQMQQQQMQLQQQQQQQQPMQQQQQQPMQQQQQQPLQQQQQPLLQPSMPVAPQVGQSAALQPPQQPATEDAAPQAGLGDLHQQAAAAAAAAAAVAASLPYTFMPMMMGKPQMLASAGGLTCGGAPLPHQQYWPPASSLDSIQDSLLRPPAA